MVPPSQIFGISVVMVCPDGLETLEGKMWHLSPEIKVLPSLLWVCEGSFKGSTSGWTDPPDLPTLFLKTTTATAAMTAAPATDATAATTMITTPTEEEEELLGVVEGDNNVTLDAAFIPAAGGTCGDEGGKGVKTLPNVTIWDDMPVIPKFCRKLVSKAVAELATSVAYIISAESDWLTMPTSKVTTIDPGTIEVTEMNEGAIFIAAATRLSRLLTREA